MMGQASCCCCKQPSSTRYHSNSKDNGVDLDNILGSLLEMDSSLLDREDGVTKINSWIDEVSPDIVMSPEQVEISRWKCIKYWEAQHSSEVYSNDYSTGVKLTGSCVRFYFEKEHERTTSRTSSTSSTSTSPRLIIEHCGRSESIEVEEEKHSCVPRWIRESWIHLTSLRPCYQKADRRNSASSCLEIVSSEVDSNSRC